MDSAPPRLPKLQPWYWAAPRIAIGLFVLAVLGLLWLLHHQEIEEQRNSLIGDTLWVEQSLHFHLTRSEEQLHRLGQDYWDDGASVRLDPRIRSLLVNFPGIVRIQVLDAEGTVLMMAPPAHGDTANAEPGLAEAVRQAFRLSRSTGIPTFSASYENSGEGFFDLVVPHFRDGKHTGSLSPSLTPTPPFSPVFPS
jgi:two-component system sensor histidine kinase DctS